MSASCAIAATRSAYPLGCCPAVGILRTQPPNAITIIKAVMIHCSECSVKAWRAATNLSTIAAVVDTI